MFWAVKFYPSSGQQTPGENRDLKHIDPLRAFKSAKLLNFINYNLYTIIYN